jgi:hypothetical protein
MARLIPFHYTFNHVADGCDVDLRVTLGVDTEVRDRTGLMTKLDEPGGLEPLGYNSTARDL